MFRRSVVVVAAATIISSAAPNLLGRGLCFAHATRVGSDGGAGEALRKSLRARRLVEEISADGPNGISICLLSLVAVGIQKWIWGRSLRSPSKQLSVAFS